MDVLMFTGRSVAIMLHLICTIQDARMSEAYNNVVISLLLLKIFIWGRILLYKTDVTSKTLGHLDLVFDWEKDKVSHVDTHTT